MSCEKNEGNKVTLELIKIARAHLIESNLSVYSGEDQLLDVFLVSYKQRLDEVVRFLDEIVRLDFFKEEDDV